VFHSLWPLRINEGITIRVSLRFYTLRILCRFKLEVCHPRRVRENWEEYVVKQNCVNRDVLMTILDNYMFWPLLAIFRLSSRELKVLLHIHIVRGRDGEISTSGLYCVICNFYIECGGD